MEVPEELEQEIHKEFRKYKGLGFDVNLMTFTDETFMYLKRELLDYRNFYPTTDRDMIINGYRGLICGVDCKISHGNLKGEPIDLGEVYFYGGYDKSVIAELGKTKLFEPELVIPQRHMRNRFEMLELN